MIKNLSKLSIAALAIFLGVSTPIRYIPASAASGTKYISEVKVGMDKTEEGAVKGLLEEGYTILSQDGKYADLNKDAGSSSPLSRGQKKVYLGFKTTTNPDEAITDLAVMNMRGGYSVRDYEALMDTRLKTEILPFVERFIVTLDEYRDNLNSPYPANKARAEYMKSMLNKLKDDDTGGLLGDLFVNETKYELGDSAYNALSEEEKKQHADIVTIIMQANGKNMLSMETLLTKATDTSETSWIDRLADNSLEELKNNLDPSIPITDRDTTLDRMFGDDANKLLEKWDTFSQALAEYDDKANDLINLSEDDYSQYMDKMNQEDKDTDRLTKSDGEAVVATVEMQNELATKAFDLELVTAKERLDEIEYDFEDGSSLAEFFAQDASVFNGDGIRNLYPIVASLSAGQLAGLDFLSIQDLVTIATADATNYDTSTLENAETVSIYEDVNREIFEKGKVAVTNKALRAEAMQNDAVISSPLSASTYVLYGATAIAAVGIVIARSFVTPLRKAAETIKSVAWKVDMARSHWLDGIADFKRVVGGDLQFDKATGMLTTNNLDSVADKIELAKGAMHDELASLVGDKNATLLENDTSLDVVKSLSTKSKICAALSVAFTVAMAVLAAFSIYSTIKELLDYYKVEYTPIPKYIVEETSITEEVNGVKTVKRNDSAYYQVAECNRQPDADYYEQLQNYADLNGDVGKQWLALYYVRQDGHAPIKADSLKVVTGTNSIPSGYSELGIHNFETTSATNLTSTFYCHNDPNKGTYVYFQLDEAVLKRASVAGSNFSTGTAFLFSGIGLAVGAGIGIAIMLVVIKRKEKVVKS